MSSSKAFEGMFSSLLRQSNDPLLSELPARHRADLPNVSRSENIAMSLLRKTDRTEQQKDHQYETRIQHKSLLLQPTSSTGDTRAVKADKEKRRREAKRKPRPMSANEKRASGLDHIPKETQLYSIYVPLNVLWTGYIREIVSGGGTEAKLLKADYHGAMLTVIKASCPSFVFLTGIVIKETRHTFVICTKQNVIKTIPKRCMVFEFQVDLVPNGTTQVMKWEVYGEHFGHRAAERVGKKFKGKSTVDF